MSDIGIGELARRAGVPVRTVRFYCDEGILTPHRSSGGHRRFAPSAVDRLRLVKRLRALGIGLPAITRVLSGERALAEEVAAQRAALDAEISALAWRRASLRAIEDASPADRAARLDLLAAVEHGRSAHGELTRFWRRLMIVPVPPAMTDGLLHALVPEPPPDPAPSQVVAYAELVAITADRDLAQRLLSRGKANAARIPDEPAFLTGAGEAYAMAAPDVLAGRNPTPGPALDRLVAVHAEVNGKRDTPEFRRDLHTTLTEQTDPAVQRYWRLVTEVTGDPAPLGAIHDWLMTALSKCEVH